MDTNIEFQTLSDLTTTLTSEHYTVTTDSTDDDGDLKSILSYAIPLSCLAIILVLILIIIIIRKRHHVLEKWTSLKQMKNTNPRFRESFAIRRDSEFDSNNRENIKSKTNSQVSQGFHLSNIL